MLQHVKLTTNLSLRIYGPRSMRVHAENMSVRTFLIAIAVSCQLNSCRADEQGATGDDLSKRLSQQIDQRNQQLADSPQNVQLYSSRGDAKFFLGDFAGALADYEKMVELDPQEDRSHWRRGIAYFYNKQYDAAASQFNRYHSFDNVDRENGIWRYLSHFESKGAEAAAKELLKYDKDDREPFGDVYKLFSGEVSGAEILGKITAAEITDSELEKRMFYANLYIGLNEAIHGRNETALKSLEEAAENSWAPRAGYGPHYMWHVARLHAKEIRKALD